MRNTLASKSSSESTSSLHTISSGLENDLVCNTWSYRQYDNAKSTEAVCREIWGLWCQGHAVPFLLNENLVTFTQPFCPLPFDIISFMEVIFWAPNVFKARFRYLPYIISNSHHNPHVISVLHRRLDCHTGTGRRSRFWIHLQFFVLSFKFEIGALSSFT